MPFWSEKHIPRWMHDILSGGADTAKTLATLEASLVKAESKIRGLAGL